MLCGDFKFFWHGCNQLELRSGPTNFRSINRCIVIPQCIIRRMLPLFCCCLNILKCKCTVQSTLNVLWHIIMNLWYVDVESFIYDGPVVPLFIHTLMCVKQKELVKNYLHIWACEWDLRWLYTSYFGLIHMSVCMKGVTSGPLYSALKHPWLHSQNEFFQSYNVS